MPAKKVPISVSLGANTKKSRGRPKSKGPEHAGGRRRTRRVTRRRKH